MKFKIKTLESIIQLQNNNLRYDYAEKYEASLELAEKYLQE